MVLSQSYLFLIFVINGILIGILFDIFRILRRSFKTKDIITYIEDIIFWILTGMLLLYSIFVFNNGEVRLFMFLGVFVGCILYMLLISNNFIKINIKIISLIKNLIKSIYTYISFPIKFIFKILRKMIFSPIYFATINIRKIIKKRIKKYIKFQKNKIKS